MLLKAFDLVRRRLLTHFTRSIKLGSHVIQLPPKHRLDWYRFRHRRYDEPVAEIAKLLHKMRGSFRAIDIGANVGDTAALISVENDVSVLCVEGNAKFLPLLKANLGRISDLCELEPSFVGECDGELRGAISTHVGTGFIDQTAEGSVTIKSLSSIISNHKRFSDYKLLKVDTDGMDAKIIKSSLGSIASAKPILYVEYSPADSSVALLECRQMIEQIISIGYKYFHVFDNYGNPMLRINNDIQLIDDLNCYLVSSRMDRRPGVYYFDICAVHSDDREFSDALRALYLECFG